MLARIRQAVADDKVAVAWESIEPETAPASDLDPDVLNAIELSSSRLWPGATVMPILELGATDGRLLRAAGIPTYGVSGVFLDLGDVRSHGRDERVRVKDFLGGLAFYDRLVRTLAR